MATIVKTPSAAWKAVIRKSGWPTTVKAFRTKQDVEDWSRRIEDEMVRGAYIQRATADRMTIQVALERYLKEVVPTKRVTSQVADVKRSRILIEHLGKYSFAALTPESVAKFRDMRLAGEDRRDQRGKPHPRTNNTSQARYCSAWPSLYGRDQRVGCRTYCQSGFEYPPTCSRVGPQSTFVVRRREKAAGGCRKTLESHACVDRSDCT